MASSAWKTHPAQTDIRVLRVPSQAQPDSENKCLVYAIWDVLHFVAEWHPLRWVQDRTPKLDVAEIEAEMTIREAGWIPDTPGEELALSERTGPIKFVHRYWESSPESVSFYELIEEKLEKDLPTIAIIDHKRLRDGTAGEGPVHSVVVTGLSDSKVIINDPWGHQYEIFNKQDFVDAWNARDINQIIRVDIAEQSTLQQSLPTGGQS